MWTCQTKGHFSTSRHSTSDSGSLICFSHVELVFNAVMSEGLLVLECSTQRFFQIRWRLMVKTPNSLQINVERWQIFYSVGPFAQTVFTKKWTSLHPGLQRTEPSKDAPFLHNHYITIELFSVGLYFQVVASKTWGSRWSPGSPSLEAWWLPEILS